MKFEEKPPPLRYLHGIGPRRAEALQKLGVYTSRDLFFLFPRRYEDRTHFVKIGELTPAENLTLRGEVLTLGIRPLKQMPLFEMRIGDETGIISAVWFNQPYLKKQFRVGMKVILNGKVDLYQGQLKMVSPEYEIVEGEEENLFHMGRITPIYPLTEGLYQRTLRSVMKEMIDQPLVEKEIHEFLPEDMRKRLELMARPEAFREIHFPSQFEDLTQARRRLVFDEFFIFEMELLRRINFQREKQTALPLSSGDLCRSEFEKSLPFRLTEEQSQALQKMTHDMARPFPMNRLLQGEVGSGKTVVSVFALFLAVRSGNQAAMLVPTEILAEQHARTLKQFLPPLGVSVELLTAGTSDEKRREILKSLRDGRLSILVGTHAVLQEEVRFKSLALVVIDEQHKFGVRQRSHLLQGSPRPHLLVMTATPIPRTLALTLYGDLEVSYMKKLPHGHSPVKTYWITREKQKEVLRHIREKLMQGEQAYFVFPTIDETEKSDLYAAREEFERLSRQELKGLPLGLVHGRLAKEEQEKTMRGFHEGKIQALIATSVIEVGVDNPNATLMVIENAERFGLSQLHQLRGRVGRGGKESECFLFGEPKTEEGKRRLRVLTKTNDGFQIAEEDLRLRGPGELLGTRQSGEPYFRLADLNQDEPLLLMAREAALSILSEDAHLANPKWEKLKEELERSRQDQETGTQP